MYYGKNHTFTSYEDNPNIYIKPGNEEVINIEGVLNIIDNNFTNANVLINGIPLGATTLIQFATTDLIDVNTKASNENEFLLWTSNYMYEPKLFNSRSLIDFSTNIPNSNMILSYTNNLWTPVNPTTYAYRSTDLIDFSTTIALDNQILYFTQNHWHPVNPTTYAYITRDLLDWSTLPAQNLQIPQYLSATSQYTPINLPSFITSNQPMSLPQLTDVKDALNPVADNYLKYTSNNQWEAVNLPSNSLNSLTDVELASNETNEVLVYGSKIPGIWSNDAMSLNWCTEVSLGTKNEGDFLIYSSGKYRSSAFNKSLNDLNNVGANPVGSGYFLEYNPITFQWQAGRIDDLYDGGEGKPGSLVINVPLILVGGFAAVSFGDINNTIKPLTNTVLISPLTVNQSIRVNSSYNWENYTMPSFITSNVPHTIESHMNVIGTGTVGNVLRHDGSNWRAQTLAINNLSDVSNQLPQPHDILVYTNNQYKNLPLFTPALEFIQSVSSTNISFNENQFLVYGNDFQLITKNFYDEMNINFTSNIAVTSLNQIKDIQIIDPQNNDILLYDGFYERWENIPFTSMGINIEMLEDFSSAIPNNYDILTGTTAGYAPMSLAHISKLNLNTDHLKNWSTIIPSNLQIPQFLTVTSQWTPYTLPNYITAVSPLITKDLLDWSTVQATNLQFPQYLSVTSKYTPISLPSFITANQPMSLDNLTDVVITLPSDRDIIYYDDTRFINIGFFDFASQIQLGFLNDVSVSSVPIGKILYCDNTSIWRDRDAEEIVVGTALRAGTALTAINSTNSTNALNAQTSQVSNNIKVDNETADTTCYPIFVSSSGNQNSIRAKSNVNLEYNASTNQLINKGDVLIEKSANGSPVSLTLNNTSNTSNSSSKLNIRTAGSSASNPEIFLGIDSFNDATIYMDNSDAQDKFKIRVNNNPAFLECNSNNSIRCNNANLTINETNNNPFLTLGVLSATTVNMKQYVNYLGDGSYRMEFVHDNPFMSVTTAGQVTKPLQPYFYAYKTGGIQSQTITTASSLILDFKTTFKNIGNCWNETNDTTFTSPVEGVYHFECGLQCTVLSTNTNFTVEFLLDGLTAARLWGVHGGNVRNSSNALYLLGSRDIYLTTGRQVEVRAVASGSNIVVHDNSFFSGRLVQ
ncbi:MAG: hypothetical protein KFKLKKLM_02644 [Flavobacteriales bacterium]|nr:hypothetical protein [Flavobacteriales bacterium]